MDRRCGSGVKCRSRSALYIGVGGEEWGEVEVVGSEGVTRMLEWVGERRAIGMGHVDDSVGMRRIEAFSFEKSYLPAPISL